MRRIQCYLWRNHSERSIAYFALRVFVGVGMMMHGLPKLAAGPDRWVALGRTVTGIGFPGPEVFWGFMAAFAEGFGGMLLVLGLLTPAAAFLIVVTMTVAVMVAHRGDGFGDRELAMFYFFNNLMFMLKGGGSYSIDRFLPGGD